MGFRAKLTGLLVLALCGNSLAQRSYDVDILAETFGFDESTKKSVALEDLRQGCPARDCIPSIDNPKFVRAEFAKASLPEVALRTVTITINQQYYKS